MCIPKYNHEGYADPTAHAALTKVFRQNQFVYICSPYRDSPRVNVMRARQYCKFAVSKRRIPLAPHLYFPQFLSEIDERGKAMSMNFELLRLCGEVWVFGEKISPRAWKRRLLMPGGCGRTSAISPRSARRNLYANDTLYGNLPWQGRQCHLSP